MPRNDFTDDDRREGERDAYRYDERGRLITRRVDDLDYDRERTDVRRGGRGVAERARDEVSSWAGDDDAERRRRDDAQRRRMRETRDEDDDRRIIAGRDDRLRERDRARYGYSGGNVDYGGIGEGVRYDRPTGGGARGWREEQGRGVVERRERETTEWRGQAPARGKLKSTDKVLAVDVMTETLTTVLPDTSIVEAARLMRDGDVGALPVVDAGGHPLGVITDRDIVCRMVAEDEDINRALVHASMTDEVYACRADDTLEEVLEEMGRHQVRRLLVIDRRDRLVGIISQADIARHAARHRRTDERREVAETVSKISRGSGPRS
jgi:CBS domain-containing protein